MESGTTLWKFEAITVLACFEKLKSSLGSNLLGDLQSLHILL